MNQWLTIAWRNVVKNRRRSLATMLAVAVGFAAVALFRGYTANTYEGLRQSAIRGEGLGHLTVFKAGWREKGGKDPGRSLFTPAEIETITALARADAQVVLVTPQILVSGLVSNGRSSQIFLAKGVIAEDYAAIAGPPPPSRATQGRWLDPDADDGILMAGLLARQLDLAPGAEAVMLSTTLEGQMNAMDIRINGTYDTGSDATNDKYLLLPFRAAQALYDTDRADRVVVLLDHWQHTEAARQRLAGQLTAAGLACEIRSWEELSLSYGKVKGMFDMIFLFLFQIVLLIVVMSTINTLTMAVAERTREIGTLRVLGGKRRSISLLFALEGACLGLLGSLAGVGLNLVGWALVRILAPTYIPPGVSAPVALVVDLLPTTMLRLTLFLTLLSMAAAIWPARRAARIAIVDALGHA